VLVNLTTTMVLMVGHLLDSPNQLLAGEGEVVPVPTLEIQV
jgi:hypothetical protein